MNNRENLEKKLRSMYIYWRNVLFTRGIAQSFGCLIACVIIGCLLDKIFNLSFGSRLMLMTAIYAVLCAFTWIMWLKDYIKPFSLERMAWLLERTFPELNEKLISSVEFAKKADEHISLQLIGKVLEDVNVDLSKIKPARAFPLKLSYFKLPITVALIFIIALFIPNLNFALLLDRVMLPSTADAYIGSLSVLIITPHDKRYNEGDTIVFKAKVTGGDISMAELVIEGRKTNRHLMDFNKNKLECEYKHTCGREGFRYWVAAEDSKSITFKIDVNKRPSIENFNISYQFPRYTKLDSLKVESTSGDIKALLNTKVKMEIKTTDVIKSAKLIIKKKEHRIKVSKDGMRAHFDLTIARTEDYSIELTSAKGLKNKRKLKYHIIALEDKSPTVNLISPENDLSVYIEDEITLNWESTDDFGVKKQTLFIVPYGNMKHIQNITLRPDEKEKKIKIGDIKIKYGSDVDIFIRAEDDAAHFGDSKRLTLYIGGLRFKDSQQFIAELKKIQDALESLKKRLHAYNELYFRSGFVNSVDKDEKEHQKRLIDQQTQQIQTDLDTAMDSAATLKRLGFFRKSSFYSELLRRYIRQEKLFSATKLTSPGTIESATARIEEMATLNRKMTLLLKRKSYQNIAGFKIPGMLKNLKTANFHKIRKFRKKAFEMAEGMDFNLLSKANNIIPLKEQIGLDQELNTLPKEQFKKYVNKIIILLAKKTKETIENYKELDKVAAEIMKKLITDDKQLRKIALKLEVNNNKEDWENLKKVAEEMRKSAEKENSKEKKLDQKLIADVLKKAEKDKRHETLRQLAKHIPNLHKQADLKDIKKSIDNLKEKFEEKMENLEQAIEKRADKASLKDRVDELNKDLEKVAADIEAVNKLNKQRLDVGRKIDQLKSDLNKIDTKIDKNQLAKIKLDTDKLGKNIALPGKSIKVEIARSKENEEHARDSIQQLAESKAEKLNAINHEVAKFAKTPQNSERNNKLLEKKVIAVQELAKLADDLRDEAAHEIEKEKADTDAAKEKVAIAAIIDKVKDAIKVDGKRKSENSELKLVTATEKIKKVIKLLEIHEKMNKSRLSEKDARKEHEKIIETANKEDKKVQELLEEIDKIYALKEAEKNITALADKSKTMEKRSNKQQAETLASKTEQEKRNLEELHPSSKSSKKLNPQWQNTDIAKNLNKKINSENLAKRINEMRKKVAQAEAYKKTEQNLEKDLRKYDAKFVKLAHDIDKKKLSELEKKRLESIKNEIPGSLMGKKRQFADEIARKLLKPDSKSAKKFKQLAQEIKKGQPTETKKNNYATLAKQQDNALKAQATQMKRALEKQKTAKKKINEKLLENLKRNAIAQNYNAVKDNLDALEKNLTDELPTKKAEEKQKDLDSKRADALTALNDAIRKSTEKKQKEKLSQAKQATLDGELKKAKALTEDAIKDKIDELTLAKNIEKANDYKKRNVDKIKQALTDLKQNKLTEAAEKLNDNPETVKEQNMLKDAAKKVNDGIEKAMTKAMESPSKPNRNLENAAKDALRNKLENAAILAKRAGKDGKQAQQSFEKALDAKKSVEKNLNNIMKNAKTNNQKALKIMAALPAARKKAAKDLLQLKHKQKNKKSSELAKQVAAMVAKNKNLKRIKDLMKAKNLHRAAEHAKLATKGAYDADKALDALADAIKEEKELAKMKERKKSPIAPSSLAEPIKDLQNAENVLNKGKVEKKATKSLENAADKLKQMAQKSMSDVQNKLAQLKNSPSAKSEPKEKGERQGNSAQLADGALGDKKQDWTDIDSTMSGENEKGRKTNYSSYYRKANKEYLNKINKEGKNWK